MYRLQRQNLPGKMSNAIGSGGHRPAAYPPVHAGCRNAIGKIGTLPICFAVFCYKPIDIMGLQNRLILININSHHPEYLQFRKLAANNFPIWLHTSRGMKGWEKIPIHRETPF
jgi:hypothetical protein